jgi:Protein of unknown function (DUF4239)
MGAAPSVIVAQRETFRKPSWPTLATAYAFASCTAAAAIALSRPEVFLRMNAVWLLVWVATTAVTLACIGQWYIHRQFSEVTFVRHNEVGGFIVAVVGTLYGVLLGFLTVIAWQHFADSAQLVAEESSAAADAWHTSVGLPAGPRSRVRRDMLLYANAMVEREWPEMASRAYDKQADLIVMDAIGVAGEFNPRTIKEGNAQTATSAQLTALHDYRYRRISDNRSGILSFEWLVLLVGAVCVIGFCWLFGVENKSVHLLMTSAVTIVITATLVLLFELQYPFQSNLRIPPDDWIGVVNHIQFMQSGPQAGMRM